MRAQRPLEGPLATAITRLVTTLDPAAIVVFGSRATDRGTPSSDHDVAVLLASPSPDLQRMLTLRLDLEEILGTDVDLVVLDDASPILAMQVLREGRLLACRDPEALEGFTVKTLTDYADLKTIRAPVERRLLEVRRQ